MRHTKRFLAAAVLAALSGTATAGSYVIQTNGQGQASPRIERQIAEAGGIVTARLPQIGVMVVEANDAGFAERAAAINGVRSAVADIALQFDLPETIEADLGAGEFSTADYRTNAFSYLQWGLDAIDAPGAWAMGHRGAGVRVAVLDSGTYCGHLDLLPNLNLSLGRSFVPGEAACNTTGSTHGTHVAGTIAAADNGRGGIGVAPDAEIVGVKVLSSVTGGGSFAGIIQGIVYAADIDAQVINMSLGVPGGLPIGGSDVAELVVATQRAVNYARQRGSLVIAAAGNDGIDFDHAQGRFCDSAGDCTTLNLRAFPAGLSNVMAVSSTAPVGWIPLESHLDHVASYTTHGRSLISVSAPGGDFSYPGNEMCVVPVPGFGAIQNPCWAFDMVLSTTSGTGGYGWSAGTSMAAPHASGVAALVIGAHNGNISPQQVESILRRSADAIDGNGQSKFHGAGRVNAVRAVSGR